MGKIIYLDRLKQFFKTTPVFRSKDMELLIKDKKYAHLILSKLSKKVK